MAIFRTLMSGVRGMLLKKRIERELDDELQEYLESATEHKMAAGMTREQAERAARIELGSIEAVKDNVRDVGWESLIESFWQDLRYGCRSLNRNRSFACAAVLILALGVGVTTAMFAVVYGVALEPLPYGDPQELVRIRTKSAQFNFDGPTVSAADAQDLRRQNTVFEDVALVRANTSLNLTGDGEPERLMAARVTANLFSTLGVKPSIGRTFHVAEERTGMQFVVLMSARLWQRRFNGDANIVGKIIRLNDQPYTVIGVMQADFGVPGGINDLWIPMVPGDENRNQYEHFAVARLKQGIQLPHAQAELDAISKRLEHEYRENVGVSFKVVPMLEETVPGGLRSSLYVLFGAVGLLLLIGCANLASLLLARTLSRSAEFQLRAALGARVRRLIGQSVAEVVPIAFLGGVVGLVVAQWGLGLLIPFLPTTMPRVENIRISGAVFGFAISLLMVTAVTVGALPVLQIRRQNIAQFLHDSFRGSSMSRGRVKARELIVISQIALAIMLLVGAGLLLRSYGELTRVDPGFESGEVLSVQLAIPRTRYESDAAVNAICTAIIERVGALPGVESVGMVNRLPLGGLGQVGTMELEGVSPTPPGLRSVDWRSITPDYFRTIGIPLTKGRFFDNRDTVDSLQVGIIDERVAELAWPNENPIGKRFRLPFPEQPWVEIVGVVGSIHHERLDGDTRPTIYWNYLQRTQDRMALVVRTPMRPEALAGSIVGAIRSVDPDQPVYDVRPLNEVVSRSVSQQWLNTTLLSVFAAASLILAAIGIYGVTSYSVGQRKREFAIRLALGAKYSDLIRNVLSRTVTLVGVGATIGIISVWFFGGVMSALLFNVGATDSPTLAVCVLVVGATAIFASYLPARRAANTDVVKSLT